MKPAKHPELAETNRIIDENTRKADASTLAHAALIMERKGFSAMADTTRNIARQVAAGEA